MGNKQYKTAVGFLKHLGSLAVEQDMSDCSDWDKLTEEEQRLFYDLLVGVQNDLSELQRLFDQRNSNIEFYRG